MIGRKLSHFHVQEQIGAGGMGIVYRAHDERLDRPVAIKVLPAGSLGDDSASARFRAEASMLARLNHPNIAIIHEFDHADGLDFLVMEYIAGESLDEMVARGPMEEPTLRFLCAQCSGLEAHSMGIIYRDQAGESPSHSGWPSEDPPQMRRISGIGDRKFHDFGTPFLEEIIQRLSSERILRGSAATMRALLWVRPIRKAAHIQHHQLTRIPGEFVAAIGCLPLRRAAQ